MVQRVGQEGLTLRRPQPQAEPSLAHITRRTSAGLRPTAPALSFALWSVGFRPFYLLASIYAAVSIPLWVCQYVGYLPTAYLRSQVWHGHEMLFGYTLAVIAGFLFTAVRTWTGQPTPTGATLAAFALLWIAGRVLIVTPYEVAAAAVNAAFPVAVAIGIGIPLCRSGNGRNYFFAAVLVLLGLAVLALHLSYLGVLTWPEWASLQVGLDLVLFILTVMGGRVIPMFTNNGHTRVLRPLATRSSRNWHWAASWSCSAPTYYKRLPKQLQCSRLLSRLRMSRASIFGNRGGRSGRRWCGSCTRLTVGLSFISCCEHLQVSGWWRSRLRFTR